MRRPSKASSPKLSTDSQRLASLALAMIKASSRLEERAWEQTLDLLVQKLLKNNHQETISAALDHLFHGEPLAYEALMDTVEAVSASGRMEHDGRHYDVLLVAIPILAWTRFSIASGAIASDTLNTLAAQLHGHVLAADTKLALAPTLYAIDQLPQTHVDTYILTQRMGHAALTGKAIPGLSNPPQTAPFFADTRYLLAAVAAPSGSPLFRWQEASMPANIAALQAESLKQWQSQATPSVERLLPGCGFELLLPEAYYVACREGDKRIRPISIRAAVNFLTHVMAAEPAAFSAIVGGFTDQTIGGRVDEYRISFALKDQPEVIYGVVWPLYGQEDAEEDLPATGLPGSPEYKTPLQEIMALLQECGITDITVHNELFQMDFCEDCGAPLYCDREAELVHTEMPEDVPQGSDQLH